MTTNINVIADSVGSVGGAGGSNFVGGAGSTQAVGGSGTQAVGGSGTQAVGGVGAQAAGIVGTQAAGIVGNMQASGGPIESHRPVPGWPTSWQPPRVTPHAFEPLSFVLNAGQLVRAVAACSPDQLQACHKGDSAATAQLLIEILKQVHSDPQERNVYLNPRRADQSLVYSPGRWEARDLASTGSALFDQIMGEMEAQSASIPPEVRETIRAVRLNYGRNPHKVTTISLPSLSAHLENLRHQTASGEDWLGSAPPARGTAVRWLGIESCGHVDDEDPTFAGLACMLGVFGEGDIPEDACSLAARAVVQYARLMLNRHPENLCLLPGPDGQVYAHMHRRGWVLRPRKEVAKEHAKFMLDRLEASLRYARKTVLRGLLPSLQGRGEKIVRELGQPDGPMITSYIAAAERYYESLPPISAVASDARYQARDILARLRVPPPARLLSSERSLSPELSLAILTPEDLDELLGG